MPFCTFVHSRIYNWSIRYFNSQGPPPPQNDYFIQQALAQQLHGDTLAQCLNRTGRGLPRWWSLVLQGFHS